jgi:tetratricopeptide (TPR) repeat protein
MTKIKKIHSFGLVLFFIAAVAVPRLAAQQKDEKDRQIKQEFQATRSDLEKGKKDFNKKEFDKAEQTLLKVLSVMPENAEASFYLAQVYYEKGDVEKGLAAIVEAEKNFPMIQKFLSRPQTGPISEPVTSGEKQALLQDELMALEYQKGEPVVGAAGGTLTPIDKPRESQPGVQGTISKVDSPPPEYSYVHGNLLFLEKKYQESFAQYKKALAADRQRGSAVSKIAIANIYYMAGKYDKALEYIKKAEARGVKIDPEFKKAVLQALGK